MKTMSKDRFIFSDLIRFGLVCLFSLLCIVLSGGSVLAGSYDPITCTVSIDCLEIKNVDDFKYKIKIKPQDNAPAPVSDELEIKEDNSGEFKVTVDEPGTYDYLIYQVVGDDKDITYDTTQYEAHLFVTSDENGKLQYQVSVNIANTAKKPIKIEFVNKTTKGGAEDDTEATTQTPTTEEPTEDTEDTEEVTTEKKTDEGGKEQGKNKKTGDETYLLLWVNILVISFIGIIVLIIERKRHYNNQNE